VERTNDWMFQRLRRIFDEDTSKRDEHVSFTGCSYIITTRPAAPATSDHPQLVVGHSGNKYLLACCCPGIYVVVRTKTRRAKLHDTCEWLRQLTRQIAERSHRRH